MHILIALLSGCCGQAEPPILQAPEGAWTDVDTVWELPLEAIVVESDRLLEDLEFEVEAGEHLDPGIQDLVVYAIPEPGWSGRETMTLRVTDRCDQQAEVSWGLGVGAMGGDCDTVLVYAAQGSPTAVDVSGSFNEWGRTPMDDRGDGTWTVSLPLSPGAYPYKLVEHQGGEQWTCDPGAELFQCDEGYDPSAWSDCSLGAASCNSLLVVEDCSLPGLELASMEVDEGAGTASLRVTWTPGAGGEPAGQVEATLDDAPLAAAEGWTGEAPLELDLSDLDPGHHVVRVRASDTAGHPAEELYVPLWTDGLDWGEGLMYYAFVDRFDNGTSANDGTFGTTHAWTDYMGGDWQGVIDRLDYLESLGVTAIWLTAPQDNPDGVWGEECGATFTGYHGYWPSHPFEVEEHFGDDALLRELIDEAHDRGMRVLVDWVANHVHVDHPYHDQHPDWYNPERLCDDANNWDDIPETCWFDSFLPDIDYYDPLPLVQMVDDAVVWAREYELDGYRVDAVKHMPHPVYWNLQSRVRAEIEHTEAGGTTDFYTVGETFDGDRGLIASYVGERELDAQFDFPLYFTLRSAFTDRGADLYDLQDAWEASRSAFAGHTMSTFLGNHDVERFITVADVGAWGRCADEDHLWEPAQPPTDDEPYLLLRLAWTWLLTHEGLPLVYYGDEIGLPGHQDPDNRQLMRFGDALSSREAAVLEHVRALGTARLDHPQLATGDEVVWWEEPDVWAWARLGDRGALVVVNRSWEDRTLTNGLSWAGLAQGTYRDVLTGTTLSSSGDQLSVTVPAMGSVVLVEE